MSRRGLAVWLRRSLVVVLVCAAAGAALVWADAQGGVFYLAALSALTLLAALALWRIWRGRRLPRVPAPPWRAALQAIAAAQPDRTAPARALRRQLLRANLRARLQPLSPCPRPPAAPQPRHLARISPARRARRALPRVRLPLPALDVQFVAPGNPSVQLDDALLLHDGLASLLGELLAQLGDAPPLVALHDHPRQVACQFATVPLLTAGQQREIVRALAVHGLAGHWDDIARLSFRRESLAGALPAQRAGSPERLWLPVLRAGQATVWWPLARTQHLVLAGAAQGPLAGLVGWLGRLPAEARPALLVHDPDRRLRDLSDTLAALPVQGDALAQARRAQLTQRFAYERGQPGAPAPPPILLMVAPSADCWPDLQPLLAPASGVQVVIILSDRLPFGALRAVCHQLPVIEIPDPRFAALPDAFRPAGLPAAGVGQALAWLPGGQIVWRGMRREEVLP